MASIGATTTHSIKVVKKSGTNNNGVMSTKLMGTKKKLNSNHAKKKSMGRRGSVPPRLLPEAFATLSSVSKLKDTIDDERRREMVSLYLLKTMGEPPTLLGSPKTASTTRDRSSAAADLAILTREFGIPFVLKQCGVLEEMKRTLLLNNNGIDDMFFARNNTNSSMHPSSSTASLASLESTTAAQMTIGTDTKRGKTTPAVAREGSLLLVRALAETLQPQKVEPYLMMSGFLAAALDECGSSHSSVRQAAEDASSVLIGLLNGYSLTKLVFPLLMLALENSTEWRVKHNALERLAQCAKKEPLPTHKLLPTLIPLLTTQVWDTKPQVTKAAASTLLAVCQSNVNPDIAPAIPAVCRAIGKPSLTHEAISELMHTTLVAAVEAPTLAILCPVLARGLKENRALTKRAACLVISNMSRLVDQPDSVAPFGPLLVPELTKVAQNVQFEEIRDAALEALANLTKALGYAYNNNNNNNNPTDPQEQEQEQLAKEEEEKQRQHDLVKEKQRQIESDRLELAKKLEAQTKKEQEERKQFKLAMEAQRQLDKHQEEQEAKQKQLEAQEKEKQKLSTKGASGKCQGCGLKKCKKTCLFYSN